MIGSALSVLSSVASLHSWVSGIRQGEAQESILDEIRAANIAIEKLSDQIYYAEELREVKVADGSTRLRAMERKADVFALLDPLQRSLGQDLLSTAMLSTTDKLQAAFQKDPWDVLFSIRPLARARAHSNPDALPIIFSDENSHYVGWQMKGTLPSLFGCEYDEAKGLFAKTGEVLVPSIQSIAPGSRTEGSRRSTTRPAIRPTIEPRKEPQQRSIVTQTGAGPLFFEHEAYCDTAFGQQDGFVVSLGERGLSFRGKNTKKFDFEIGWSRLARSSIAVVSPTTLRISLDRKGKYSIKLTKAAAEALADAIQKKIKSLGVKL